MYNLAWKSEVPEELSFWASFRDDLHYHNIIKSNWFTSYGKSEGFLGLLDLLSIVYDIFLIKDNWWRDKILISKDTAFIKTKFTALTLQSMKKDLPTITLTRWLWLK